MKNFKENLIQEVKGSQETPKKQGLEVVVSAKPGSLQQTLSELGDAIGHDVLITTDNLDNLDSAIRDVKLNIGGKEMSLTDAEKIPEISNLLKKTNIERWDVQEEDLPTFKFEFKTPKELDYKFKAEHRDLNQFGQYTVNPETFGMNFEKAEVFIPDLSSMVGKYVYEVFQYVVDTYSDKYYVPGIEYWKWALENTGKFGMLMFEQSIKFEVIYFPGSIVCDQYGEWGAPALSANVGGYNAYQHMMESHQWSDSRRVILLKK